MRILIKKPSAPLGRKGLILLSLLVSGILLAAPSPAVAQIKILATANRLNHKICGHVDDYTHNGKQDRRLYSPILRMPRDLYVYVPPGYSRQNAYPVMLYFHPASVDEHIFVGTNWIVHLDQMIRRGEVPPVIVACPDGVIEGEDRRNSSHSMYVNGVNGRFQDHILQEVLPFLIQNYSIRPEREAHAVFGTSAGGMGAMNLAIKRRDFFGAVATLAGPVNLRYSNCHDNYHENFDPATYRWNDRYDPEEIVGTFYLGLSKVRAKKYVGSVFGDGDVVPSRIARENPADLLFTTDLQPGQLAIYVNYPGRDNYNFDAHAESFAWLASQKGICLTLVRDPCGRHNLPYFRANHERAFRWLGSHLLPPVPLASPH